MLDVLVLNAKQVLVLFLKQYWSRATFVLVNATIRMEEREDLDLTLNNFRDRRVETDFRAGAPLVLQELQAFIRHQGHPVMGIAINNIHPANKVYCWVIVAQTFSLATPCPFRWLVPFGWNRDSFSTPDDKIHIQVKSYRKMHLFHSFASCERCEMHNSGRYLAEKYLFLKRVHCSECGILVISVNCLSARALVMSMRKWNL